MEFTENAIAPCGINCGVCIAYLRERNKCGGCRIPEVKKVAHADKCSIKFCEEHNKREFIFCCHCERFPCVRIKKLDKRYVEKYQLSTIENLTYIKEQGLKEFIEAENQKWICSHCGQVLCVHKKCCLNCGTEYK